MIIKRTRNSNYVMVVFQVLYRTSQSALSSVKRAIHLNLVRTMSSACTGTILVDEKGDKGIITLNRPKALNAANLDMIR